MEGLRLSRKWNFPLLIYLTFDAEVHKMEAYRGFLLFFFFFFRVNRGVHAHTFSLILILSNYRKCMGRSRFSKIWSRTSLHSRFSVLFLWTRKLLFSNTKHQMKYMNSGRNSGLWNKSSNFPPPCPDYPWCNYERELLYCEIIKKLNLALWLTSNGWQMSLEWDTTLT